jgi:hypothetical protein
MTLERISRKVLRAAAPAFKRFNKEISVTTVDFRPEGRAKETRRDETSWLVSWGSFVDRRGVVVSLLCPNVRNLEI